MQKPSVVFFGLALPCLLGLLLIFSAEEVHAEEGRLFALRSMKNLSFPLGEEADRPTAFFRCGAVTTEKRRLGILQFGLHPRWIFQDVELRITAHGAKSGAMSDIAAFFAAEPFLRGGRIDGLVLGNDASRWLVTAETAEYSGNEQEQFLVLKDGAIEKPDEPVRRFVTGVVALTGSRTGKLVITENPGLTIDLDQ
jgi:hypothetical protein